MALDFLTLGIPVVFTLAIVYGALETASPIKNKKSNALISVIIALFVATYEPAVSFINGVLPYAIALFVVVFFLGFLKKTFGSDKKGKKDSTGLFLSLGLILIFLAYQQGGGGVLDLGFSSEMITTAGIVIVLIILYTAYKMDKEK